MLLAEQANTAPPEIRSLATGAVVPEPLARVIMQNLSKSPSERAPDARVLGRALVEASRRAHLGADEIGLSSTLLGTKTTRRTSTVRAVAVGPSLAFEATPKLAVAALSRQPSPSLIPSLRGDDERPSDPKLRARRRRARAVRRAGTFIACFVLGIVAALVIASGFGVFERPPAGQAR
jgi:serine/threonine-protein kinase